MPTSDAKGWEQSEAVLSMMFDIVEKLTGHLPVKTGSYIVGKVGYIGGKDSAGYGFCGRTLGDISMGSNSPVIGGVASSIIEEM